ncbi:hypothetical protein BU25DRAFT_474335 [Macroventuria anomochaeta]|uniref:Uncharacterized protein n=1 Tax=Macroventuria anomochaeta TaxID=301207 RepID=A0ACB6RT02_9PLEO|nr:uncharacterized protein BU25DRAFT_474335 [Macroventuria anomochaeta]KAF2624853.1 hypothetical protein BU25DRAFT_474335 [Macroventuria anomochaeta]
MANLDAGRSLSRRNSNVSLGLVGVPSMQESVQTEDEFEFDSNPNVDLSADLDADLNAHIDAFCTTAGLPTGQSLNDLEVRPTLAPLKTNFAPSDLSQPYILTEQYPYAYNKPDLSSFSVQQNLAYPEPWSYYLAHETPYFDDYYGALAPPGYIFGTMGLTALPGNNAIAGYGNVQYPSNPYGNPIEFWTLPANVTALPTVHTGYVPVEASSYNDTTMQFATYPVKQPQAVAATQALTIETAPSLETNIKAPIYTEEPAQQEQQESDSDSDEDYRDTETNTTMISKRETRKQPRKDSVNSASTSTATPSEPVKYLPGEKPKKVDAKPWIRTNTNTEGDTRTAKINNWKNNYVYKPLPLGTWGSGKHTFTYTQYENVDFLTEAPMSTRKIKEYIMNYPCDDQKRLVIWIQKMPADQGRRYGSKQHSKCAFRDCPIQRYVEGTISTGEYRVAFDEKHYMYGGDVDPYDCAAYAHLYCMEQFLDFEQVCQVADVRLDTRLDMPLEPNGKAAFSMVDVPARYELERFIKAASKGKLRLTPRWHNYPFHADYERDQQKPHERTLTYLAHCMYEAHQDDSHKKQAALRRVTVSQRRVHLGDLEMSVADKHIMIEVFGGKKKGRKGKVEDHYNERIRYQINRAKQEAEDFLKEKRQGKNSVKKSKKRKIIEHEGTDDEEPVYETAYGTEQHAYATPSRKMHASRHKKQRINCAESPIDTQQQHAQTAYMQPQPVQAPEQQTQHFQTYMATNFTYSPTPAPCQPLINPVLDTPYGLYAVPATPKLDISDFSDFPTCEDDIPDDNLEKLLALDRRQSCTAEFGPMSILKSPELTRGGCTPRRAVFGAQPVSESKEYGANDPPSLMSGRRSARIAAKGTVGERRMRKRARSSR